MYRLLEIYFRRLITGYIGALILLLYYRLKGKDITRRQILDEIDPKSGIKLHYIKAYYTGVIFLIFLVLIVSTAMGLNPKIYNPNK